MVDKLTLMTMKGSNHCDGQQSIPRSRRVVFRRSFVCLLGSRFPSDALVLEGFVEVTKLC